MRMLLIALFALLATPAFAQSWDHYDNMRFSYGVDVPPGFAPDGEFDVGDGLSFYNPAGAKGLLVWGSAMTTDFEAEVAAAMDYASAENAWNITAQTSTPRWASFSGIKGIRILHQRMIPLCDGVSYAGLRVEYAVTDTAAMEPVVERLMRTFRANGC